MKIICKWGITSSEHGFWNKPQLKALEPGNVYSQNTQGIRSLYGLAVPDKEAPISRCFREQILGFGSSYVAVTPRLITWHPVCDPKKVQTSGASHLISRRVFQAKSKWAQLLSPAVFIFFIVRTPKVAHFTCSSPAVQEGCLSSELPHLRGWERRALQRLVLLPHGTPAELQAETRAFIWFIEIPITLHDRLATNSIFAFTTPAPK